MPRPDLETSALQEWINSFRIGRTVKSSAELSDGFVLWEILQDIDAQHFLGDLPESSSSSDHWVPRWQNLKHIHKLLLSYVRDQNDGEMPAGLSTVPDLKAIAENSSTRETNQLLKLLLMAAISSPNAESYIVTMQSLSTQTQEGLKDIIQEAHDPSEDRLEQLRDEQDDFRARREVAVDPELQFEERVSKLLAENDKLSHEKKELGKAMDDLHDRLARLQEHNDTLQDRLTSTEDRLATLRSGKGGLGLDAKTYEDRTRQQEDIIAAQEAKLTGAQEEIESLQMSLESLRVKNQRYQKLQDDYDEVKNERDQLSRKANAAEKYRQKLQASQDFEKENQALKNQVRDLQQQLKEIDSSQRTSSERDVELEEYRRLLPRIEQDRHEVQNLKKQLEFNNHALTERLQLAEEQHARDEATISELRDHLRELQGFDSSSTGAATPKAQRNLERDLDELGRRESHLDTSKASSPTSSENDHDFPSESDSESYRKLHTDYTAVRSKLADAEGRLEITERQLSDVKAECKFTVS
jgi:protein HOOK3